MSMGPEITAFIPARSGSTRLPNKNLQVLAGMSLAALSVLQALASKSFSSVIFSSDSPKYLERIESEILSSGEDSRALTLHRRNPDLSGSKAKIRDVLRSLAHDGVFQSELVALLLPTSPFRSIQTLNRATQMAQVHSQPVFTACAYEFPVSFAFEAQDVAPFWIPLQDSSPMLTGNTRSQEQATYLRPHGGCVVTTTTHLESGENTIYHNARPLATSRLEGLDIDTESDLFLARAALESLGSSPPFLVSQ